MALSAGCSVVLRDIVQLSAIDWHDAQLLFDLLDRAGPVVCQTHIEIAPCLIASPLVHQFRWSDFLTFCLPVEFRGTVAWREGRGGIYDNVLQVLRKTIEEVVVFKARVWIVETKG